MINVDFKLFDRDVCRSSIFSSDEIVSTFCKNNVSATVQKRLLDVLVLIVVCFRVTLVGLSHIPLKHAPIKEVVLLVREYWYPVLW